MSTWCKACGIRINGWWNKEYIEGEYCEKHNKDSEITIASHPICRECNKEIWGIAKIQFTIGVELPTLLHSVCYERLKEIEWIYKDLCDET